MDNYLDYPYNLLGPKGPLTGAMLSINPREAIGWVSICRRCRRERPHKDTAEGILGWQRRGEVVCTIYPSFRS